MLTERIQMAKDNYVNSKPHISYERARIWTEAYKKTEGEPVITKSQGFRRRL